jgi:hypothetical protein
MSGRPRSPAIRPGFVLLAACSALARRVRNRIGATDPGHESIQTTGYKPAISGGGGNQPAQDFQRPGGLGEPRIIAGLQDVYLTGSRANVEGTFTVVGQVGALLSGDQVESTIRVIRDVPPTQKEVETINEAISHFIEPGRELGVEIDASDINIPAPAVVLRPIAIFQ